MNQVNVYFYSLWSVYETVNTYCMFSSSKIHFFYLCGVRESFSFSIDITVIKKKKKFEHGFMFWNDYK